MQALERAAPTLPMKPGLVERQEADYVRHGTQVLTANFEVATGQVVCPTVGDTRTEADFAAHVGRTVATDPDAGWVFVVDQLNTHQSATLVGLVATLCGVADPLGHQGQGRRPGSPRRPGGRSWRRPATACGSCSRRGTRRG